MMYSIVTEYNTGVARYYMDSLMVLIYNSNLGLMNKTINIHFDSVWKQHSAGSDTQILQVLPLNLVDRLFCCVASIV